MGRQVYRLVAALIGVLLTAGLALVATATSAEAHATLLATSPRADQVLANAPKDIVLSFSDPVDPKTATVQLVEPTGVPVPGVSTPIHIGGSDETLSVTLPASLGDGTRSVIWRVVSTDGHPIQGTFRFSVGVATASAAPDVLGGETDLGLYLGIARWVAFVGLALAVGTLLLVFLGWPGGLAVPAIRRLTWSGLGALTLASVASLLLYGPYVAGGGISGAFGDLDLALETKVGKLLVARLVLLAVVVGALALWLRRTLAARPPALDGAVDGGAEGPVAVNARVGTAATLFVGGALALTWSLATHSAGGGNQFLTLPVDLAHMIAMSAWIGGMPALLVLLLKVKDTDALARAVPIFSRTAAVCVAALLATGVIQAWRQVGSADALTSTEYGGWLLVKLALVALIVGLGALARWWAAPRLLPAPAPARVQPRRRTPVQLDPAPGSGRFGRIVALETGFGALVLAVTATLVSTQPAAAVHEMKQAEAGVNAVPGSLVATPVESTIGFRLAEVAKGAAPVEYATPLEVPAGPDRGIGWAEAVISPAFGGLPNELHLSVSDRKAKPLGIGGAMIQLRSGTGPERSDFFPLRSTGLGHFSAPFTVPTAGQWQLAIALRNVDGTEAVVLIPFEARMLAT